MDYLVNCSIAVDRRDRVADLRPAHLEYIRANRARLRYGGVVAGEDGQYEAIVFVLIASSPQDARAFVAADPYNPLFAHVTISRFQQKIPPPIVETST